MRERGRRWLIEFRNPATQLRNKGKNTTVVGGAELVRPFSLRQFSAHPLVQPRLAEHPVTFRSGRGDLHRVGRLLDGHSHEIPEFHEFGFLRFEERELVERLIESNQILVRARGGDGHVFRVEAIQVAAVFRGPFLACGVDENPAHRFGRSRKEVPTVVELLVAPESQVRLVNERGGFERVPGLFGRELRRREPTQLVVHEREQFRGPGPARPNVVQNAGDLVHGIEDKPRTRFEQRDGALRSEESAGHRSVLGLDLQARVKVGFALSELRRALGRWADCQNFSEQRTEITEIPQIL